MLSFLEDVYCVGLYGLSLIQLILVFDSMLITDARDQLITWFVQSPDQIRFIVPC